MSTTTIPTMKKAEQNLPNGSEVEEAQERLEELTLQYLRGQIDIETYNDLTEKIEGTRLNFRKIASVLSRGRINLFGI